MNYYQNSIGGFSVNSGFAFDYGRYVQTVGGGSPFVDANGDVWTYSQGSAGPEVAVNVGAMIRDNSAMAQVQASVPFQTPEAPQPVPAYDPAAWLRAVGMMQAEKSRKRTVMSREPDLAEAWGD